MNSQTNDLGCMSLGKLLLKLAVPAILAQVINALYNIVDRIYIGNMGDNGYLALTGIGLTFPIITFISAFSNLIGIGGAPLMSMSLGGKNVKKAQQILGSCIVAVLALSVILTVVFLILKRPFLYAFGASDATILYAEDYIEIYLIGTVFVMVSLGLNPFINAQGFSRTGMITVVIGAAANILLDPFFIFVLDLGVKGAAIATIISQGISAIWVLLFLFGKKATVKIQKQYLKLEFHLLKSIVSLGISPFIMTSTESLVMVVLNSQLQSYGNDYYVGAMTVISSIMQFVSMPISGLTQGAQPIISYNYGARQIDRVKGAFKLTLICCIGFNTIVWALIMLFPQFFISIFNNEASLLETAVWGIRIHMAMFFMLGIQNACQNTFVALGQAKISLFLALLRKVILLVPLSLILPLFWGVEGIFFAEPIADFFAAASTGTIFFLFYRKTLAKL